MGLVCEQVVNQRQGLPGVSYGLLVMKFRNVGVKGETLTLRAGPGEDREDREDRDASEPGQYEAQAKGSSSF